MFNIVQGQKKKNGRTETNNGFPGSLGTKKRLGTVATLWTKRAFSKRENDEPYPVVFFFSLCKMDYTKAASDCSVGKTICVTQTICIFCPYFQPITLSLSVMSSIINNLAFILTHVAKPSCPQCVLGKGKAVTSDVYMQVQLGALYAQFFFHWQTLHISGE